MRYRIYKFIQKEGTQFTLFAWVERGILLDTRKDILYYFYLPDQVGYFKLPIKCRRIKTNKQSIETIKNEHICDFLFEIKRICQLETKLIEYYFEYFL